MSGLLHYAPSKLQHRIHLRHYTKRHYRNATSSTIKSMYTVLKSVSDLSLLCFYTHLYSVCVFILWVNCTIVLHTAHNHHHSSAPTKSQDDVRLDPDPLHRPAPVILILLPQSLRIQHLVTCTQLAGEYDLLTLDGSVSPCQPHAVTQIPLSMSFLPLYITVEGSWGWVNIILGSLSRNTSFITICHVFITWMLILIFMLYPGIFREKPLRIKTFMCTFQSRQYIKTFFSLFLTTYPVQLKCLWK